MSLRITNFSDSRFIYRSRKWIILRSQNFGENWPLCVPSTVWSFHKVMYSFHPIQILKSFFLEQKIFYFSCDVWFQIVEINQIWVGILIVLWWINVLFTLKMMKLVSHEKEKKMMKLQKSYVITTVYLTFYINHRSCLGDLRFWDSGTRFQVENRTYSRLCSRSLKENGGLVGSGSSEGLLTSLASQNSAAALDGGYTATGFEFSKERKVFVSIWCKEWIDEIHWYKLIYL